MLKYKEGFINFMLKEVASAKRDSSFFDTSDANGTEAFKDMTARAMYTGFKAGIEFAEENQKKKLPKDFGNITRGMKFTEGDTLWVICGFVGEPPAVRAYDDLTGSKSKTFELDDHLVKAVKEFYAIWGNKTGMGERSS